MSIQLPFNDGSIAELGGGETPVQIVGRTITNIDVRDLPQVDIVQDLEQDFSGIGKWDNIFCSYLAEHISWRKVKTFFRSCYNILNPHGVAVFIVPNTLEQVMHLASKPDWTLEDSCLLFGDQNYSDNTHKWALRPELVGKLLQEAGFERVEVHDHPNPEAFDMIIHAYKGEEKEVEYEVDYFNGGVYLGAYRDFPCHHKTVAEVVKRKPESVVDLGGARGYISKHLGYYDIQSTCMDISKHCWHTRATDSFILQDLTETPWMLDDNEFDLAFSCAWFEHISPDKLDDVIRESMRISKRGFHGITFTITDDDIDHTHLEGTIMPREAWMQRFHDIDPDYPVEIVDKEELESQPIPIPVPDDGFVKINVGSFTEMFHYGWENWDILDLSQFAQQNAYKFRQVDIRQPLQIPDNSVDYYACHHTIEHLTREEGKAFLKEVLRTLKPGGVIRLSFPCAWTLATKYVEGNLEPLKYLSPEVVNAEDDVDAFWRLLTGGHLTAHDDTSLVEIMNEVGFNAELSYFDSSEHEVIKKQTMDSCPTISSYVEGQKPFDSLPQSKNNGDALLRYLNE